MLPLIQIFHIRFANLTEAAQLLDYIFMCITYLFFYRALKAQGIDRNTLPYKGWVSRHFHHPLVLLPAISTSTSTFHIHHPPSPRPKSHDTPNQALTFQQGQPYIAWAGLISISLTLLTYGYLVFVPGYWSTASFIDFYLMVAVCPVLYVGWKLLKKTKIVSAQECDLVWDKPQIDAYEAGFVEVPGGFWGDVRKTIGMGKKKG